MSDTDVDPGLDPSNFILREQRSSMAHAMSSLADDPEKAARSVELGDATGDNPTLIYPNLENYEEQHKAALTASLLTSNKYLRQYVDADPMHAKISNDDYGNLDSVSEQLKKLSLPMRILRLPEAGGSIFSGAWDGFKKGFGDSPSGSWLTDKDIKEHRLGSAVAATLAMPVEGVLRFGSGVLEGAKEGVKEGAKAGYQQLTGDEQGAEQFSRDLASMVEQYMMGTSGVHAPLVPDVKFSKAAEKIRPIIEKASPWLDESREPPRGLDPEIDKLKFEQNKIDLGNLDEALKAAQESATRERSPEIFASFIRQHSDASIGISGDAVAKLYGGKVPEAGDNILGWSPRIAEELRTAVATGGDVQVPLADWLAKVDPEVAKELHDDIRVRPGGITKAEKVAEAEAKKVPGDNFKGEPLPNAGLVPANMATDGTIYVGTKNSQHFELSQKHGADMRKEQGLQPGEGTWKETGFVTPDGKFLNRQEAFDWVTANEKQIKPSENMEGIGLDALDYREQVPEGRRKKLQPPQPSKVDGNLREELANLRGANSPLFDEREAAGKAGDEARVAELTAKMQANDKRSAELRELLGIKQKVGFIPVRDIIPEPLPSVRGASGLEPMFSIGDRKLTLEKRPARFTPEGILKSDEFRLMDENGKNAGWLEVIPFENGKRLYIDNVGGFESRGYGPNAFGPALTRNIARQLKEIYPEATHIGGFRISGAREKAGTTREIWIKFDELEGPKGWTHVEAMR